MRFDRIIPLSRLAFHPNNDYADIVFFIPKIDQPKPLRIWLYTSCKDPVVKIDDYEFGICSEYNEGLNRWIDLGVTEELKGHFGQLRIFNMSYEEAMSSWFLITEQISLRLCGDIEDAEEILWGISKKDVGRSSLTPSIVTGGEPVVYTMTYHPGEHGLPAGTKMRLAIPHSMSVPQQDDPNEDGYICVKISDPFYDVYIEDFSLSKESHVVNDVILNFPKGIKKEHVLTVQYKCDVTPIFNAYYPYAERMYWYIRQAPLSFAVCVPSNNNFVEPLLGNGHSVEYKPGPCKRLFLNVPGRIKEGTKILCRGVFTDKFRNTPPSGYPNTDIRLYLSSGVEEIQVDEPMNFDTFYSFKVYLKNLSPGRYRLIAKDINMRIISKSNPLEIMNTDDRRDSIYFGEIHGHCVMSDGSGEYVDMYRHARDVGCLDFAASADHACYFSDNEWELMQSITNSFNDPDRFVTLIGFEWAGKQVHRNVYTCDDSLKLFRGMYEPTSNIDKVYGFFKGNENVVAGPHGSIAHGIKWEYHEPEVERFIEMYSMWGANDFPDSPLLCTRGYHPPRMKTVNEILATGAVLGFTGGGDCHEGRCGFSCEDPDGQGKTKHTFAVGLSYRCGLTGAHMNRLDRTDLIKAIRNRKTYATTGAKILLDFEVNGFKQRDLGSMQTAVKIKADVCGCDVISQIIIVRNGERIHCISPNETDAVLEWEDLNPLHTKVYYYVQVIQKDGQMAWSSPVYLC